MMGSEHRLARRASGAGEITGRHVLFVVLSFFGLVFAVNGVFLYSALSTHSGVVAQEPYRKGLAYNERIRAGAAQEALGWSHAVTLERDGALSITITDQAGAAVRGLDVRARVGRPSTDRHDRSVRLSELRPGVYAAEAGGTVLEPGAWLVEAEAGRPAGLDGGTVYRLRTRQWLKP